MTTAPQQQHKQALSLYVSLMEEIKIRIDSILLLLDSARIVPATPYITSRLPGPLIREFSYLQIRMICELISLSCLVAHGDIGKTSIGKTTKMYEADRIMKALDSIHEEFYPRSTEQKQISEGRFDLQNVDTKEVFTKADLINTRRVCGSHLHRGSRDKLLKANLPIETNFKDLRTLISKIIKLLSHHIISLREASGFLCA